MDTNTLNYYCLSTFVQEVANSKGKVYPARTLYGITCGIRRHLEGTVGSEVLKSLDASDSIHYVQCKILFSSKTTIIRM